MPLNIVVNAGARPVPQIVPPAVVVQQARAAGNPRASRALAVTRPVITIDQRGLQYYTRPRRHPREFRFNTGVLRLTLRQSIYIANNLPGCAQGIWAQHEQDHARDNQAIMGRMERQIRLARDLQDIFFTPRWHPMGSFNAIQNRIETSVGSIFRKLTLDAVRDRDTVAEYARVQRRILRTCPDPFYHEVFRGETLSRLARFYYGSYRSWRSIYRANRQVIGGNPDLIHPGQRLLIPKRP